jgi:hypothetical protein
VHWHESKHEPPGGLELLVEPGDAPARPAFHLQAEQQLLRLMVLSSPLLWARRCGEGYCYLRSDRDFSVLEPLTALLSRAAEAPMGSAGYRSYWARELAARLMASPVTPLHPGRWSLRPATALPSLAALSSQQSSGHSGIGPLPPLALRPLSAPGGELLKLWRGAFRDGSLPPILMMWMSGLERLVILDGHDRLAAALAEGGLPEVMILSLADEGASSSWPLPGGAERWLEEVRRHLPDAAESALSGALLAGI